MNPVIKTTFKNIFGKPLRTFLVVFSIFVCSLAAMFCFDLARTERGVIESIYKGLAGNADLLLTLDRCDREIPSDLPDSDIVLIRTFDEVIYGDVEGEYSVVTQKTAAINSVDIETAEAMGLMGDYELSDDEILITGKYAELLGVSVGDTMTIHDMAGNELEFTVAYIVPEDAKTLLFRGLSAVVNGNAADTISRGKVTSADVVIDVTDDSMIDQAESSLRDAFGDDAVTRFAIDAEGEAMLQELTGFMVLLFAITFLLVVFITVSICERIVSERMSYIGTLRSLGMSSRRTAVILLLENAAYALLGAIPGVAFYLLVRPGLLGSMTNVNTSDGSKMAVEFPPVSAALVAAVVLGAVAIECLIPLKAILRALKTSIRDIIFDNRDTAYKFSRTGIISGVVMAVIAAVSFIFRGSLVCAAICLVSTVTATALLFPLILRGITHLIACLAARGDNEKWALSAKEAVSRKSTVGSGILCVTSATMCILISIMAVNMAQMIDPDVYDCDTVVTCTASSKMFSFIDHLEGVNETEYIYRKMESVRIGDDDKKLMSVIFGMPDGGFRMYGGIYDAPERIDSGTICVEKAWAARRGLSVGDTLTITFDPDGVFPIVREFEIASFFKIDSYEGLKNNFLISENDYKEIYHDVPGEILIRCDDPEKTSSEIGKYAAGSIEKVQTKQEIADEAADSNASSGRVFGAVIVTVLAMTCIGMVTNQLIGFEGRRKECAVMLSTSMNRKTLSGLLFREMLITSAISSTLGAAEGSFLLLVIKAAVENSDSLMMPDMNLPIPFVAAIWLGMTVLFVLTVLFPIKNMKKMKLSEQLKYE